MWEDLYNGNCKLLKKTSEDRKVFHAHGSAESIL
jgi:hypothetical protein